MDIFIDAHQYGKIKQAENRANTAAEKASRAQDAFYELERKQEKMALACQALLELIQEHSGITDSQIEEKILEIDLRDGSADGKIGTQILNCPHCGRKTNTARNACYYCGAKIQEKHLFE